MKLKQYAIGAVVLLGVFAGGYAAGETSLDAQSRMNLTSAEIAVNNGVELNTVEGWYDTVVATSENPQSLDAFLRHVMYRFARDSMRSPNSLKASEGPAAQMMKMQVVELRQNQRIITLLEQIAAQKRPAGSE